MNVPILGQGFDHSVGFARSLVGADRNISGSRVRLHSWDMVTIVLSDKAFLPILNTLPVGNKRQYVLILPQVVDYTTMALFMLV